MRRRTRRTRARALVLTTRVTAILGQGRVAPADPVIGSSVTITDGATLTIRLSRLGNDFQVLRVWRGWFTGSLPVVRHVL